MIILTCGKSVDQRYCPYAGWDIKVKGVLNGTIS